MSDWRTRPRIEATLLNPALVAVILARSAVSYETEAGRPMPWPMAFLIPPLVLHKPTRTVLPRDTRTHLPTWVSRHPLLRAGFSRRAVALRPFVWEGLRLGLRSGTLLLDQGALRGVVPATRIPTGEIGELTRAATLLGRWLARSERPSTAFVLLGVSP